MKTNALVDIGGGIKLECWLLEENYWFSPKSIISAVDSTVQKFSVFMKSNKNCIKQNIPVSKGRPIQAISQPTAIAFWQYEALNGNQRAIALQWASTAEVLTRRCDRAFNIGRTEDYYRDIFSANFEIVSTKKYAELVLSQRDTDVDPEQLFSNLCHINNCVNAFIEGDLDMETVKETVSLYKNSSASDCKHESVVALINKLEELLLL